MTPFRVGHSRTQGLTCSVVFLSAPCNALEIWGENWVLSEEMSETKSQQCHGRPYVSPDDATWEQGLQSEEAMQGFHRLDESPQRSHPLPHTRGKIVQMLTPRALLLQT